MPILAVSPSPAPLKLNPANLASSSSRRRQSLLLFARPCPCPCPCRCCYAPRSSSLHGPGGARALPLSVVTGKDKDAGAGAGAGIDAGAGTDAGAPAELLGESMPRHVAIIMDGNSRWATARGLPASAGHEAGYRSLKEIVRLSCQWGIRALTVYAFSAENWLRPKTEVDFLMMLFHDVLKENMEDFVREGIRVCVIGDSTKLPKSLQKLAAEAEEMTRNNSRLDLIVAISYSGRSDIVQACQKIAKNVKHGLLEPEDITESLIAQELETNCIDDFPYPDLLIRTSGELRLSNFLLWESAYTELYFAKTHWPDFGEADYVEALSAYQKRKRRFGLRTV